MKRSGILLILILFCLSAYPQNALLFDPSIQNKETGRVIGTVYDPHDAVFAGMKIKFTGERIERWVTTDHKGEYTVDLPAGVYQTEVDSQGILPYRRA